MGMFSSKPKVVHEIVQQSKDQVKANKGKSGRQQGIARAAERSAQTAHNKAVHDLSVKIAKAEKKGNKSEAAKLTKQLKKLK